MHLNILQMFVQWAEEGRACSHLPPPPLLCIQQMNGEGRSCLNRDYMTAGTDGFAIIIAMSFEMKNSDLYDFFKILFIYNLQSTLYHRFRTPYIKFFLILLSLWGITISESSLEGMRKLHFVLKISILSLSSAMTGRDQVSTHGAVSAGENGSADNQG